ncbi:MAG: hypothetical protein QOJ94_1157 [Sphingomonadales bacterium]|jgi:hypothetical protein|nr:hypothetical protein [Sphingomonadales bacterium]
MRTPQTVAQIDTVVEAEIRHISQVEANRHRTVDRLAATAMPTLDERGFDLERANYSATLTEVSARAAPALGHLGLEYGEARWESDFFLREHGLQRRPPYKASLLTLAGIVTLAMSLESAATSPIYEPAIGWAPAVVVASLISISVGVPAMLLGMGVVLSRHRLSRTYWGLGLAAILLGGSLLLTVMLCAAHFRQLAAALPALTANPGQMLEMLVTSLRAAPFRPLADPSNSGLFAAAAIAAAFVAWETYGTFGYVGWRRIAIREEQALQSLLDESALAEREAAVAKKEQLEIINRKVSTSRRAKRDLGRLLALDTAIVSSTTTALAEAAVLRSGAQAIFNRAFEKGGDESDDRSFAPTCPTRSATRADRTEFAATVRSAVAAHDERIEARPAAIASISELYLAFCNSLKRATQEARAGFGNGGNQPLLSGPGGWRS